MLDISFEEAKAFVRENISPLGSETVLASEVVGRVCSSDVKALVDYPAMDSSFKDGYAVCSADVALASSENPVTLELVGTLGAGDVRSLTVRRGTAVRVYSGAPLPEGADAVLAEEFARREEGRVLALADAGPGRNVLSHACEVRMGEVLVRAGEVLTPGKVSIAVAGGLDRISVFRRPAVGLLATGNEVLLPGRQLEDGKLYASNLSLQGAWLRSWQLESKILQAGDSFEAIASAIYSIMDDCDILLTSGGAWKGDRDLTIRVLESLGWRQLFHRVRLGPGKAVAMGFLKEKPVFCLPGGPPSNESAFLLIALPGVLRMGGFTGTPCPRLTGVLGKEVSGQEDWTQVFHCSVETDGPIRRLIPTESKRRLSFMASSDGLFLLPEGDDYLPAGTPMEYLSLSYGFNERW